MIKEAIATASTRDEAIQKAKAALNAPLDADVKFEIIQDAQKKVLGLFGGKDAKVRAYYEAPDEVIKETKKAAPVAPKAPAKTVPAPAKKAEKPAISSDDDAAIRNYLTTIIKGMGIEDITITSHKEEEETVYELSTSESHGALIGRHGETLDSIQYLVRLFANKNTQGKKKISLNVGDYREKRAESLKEFAARSANQVLKYGRNVKLDPMNPYERRIIHTAIQAIEGVTSHSVGYDDERRVVITLEEGVQPTHGDRRRGGYNRGGKGGYNRGGNRGGRKESYKPNVPADRAPKSDLAGSRYGKIEVKKAADEE
ncbi:MAG: protein jag [Clostridia bacterium]|nr:protein jag [Clostridia bacterium]